MLNLILEELMPLYRDVYDFATVDINRPLQGIKGFSRETIIAVVTNIESQEFRRRQIATSNLPQEHPRAGTTDDVECFFSLLRKKLGDSFTHKQFKCCWRSMCSEFCKKSRPDLPFYYFTASSHYRDENEPNFDESDETPRLHQVQMRYREDGSIFAAGRAQLPVRNHLSVRARFHRTAVDLPPPPGYERTGEHDY
ncbi:uncharacterized protein [Ptychodera flava]|uniref:uncharacterized protein n=1 Tax=Ptychodera flava TaxID=63121 RepID=UPI00396A2F8F